MTPESLRAIVNLRADPQVQARIDELAEKCNEGTLTPQERDEYETCVRANNIIGILQVKARKLLNHSE